MRSLRDDLKIMNKDKHSISVIVAVYNAELYLSKCIDSILASDYKVREIILIDDGSTDDSGCICDKYALLYPQIIVVHQDNKGQMAAQIHGINIASGDYVSFIDSDDWIEKEYFSQLACGLEQGVDAVFTNIFCLDYEDKVENRLSSLQKGVYKTEDIYNHIIPTLVQNEITARPCVFAYLPGKLFKLDKLKKTIVNLDDRIRLGQDGAVVFPHVFACNSISIVECNGYHYIQRTGSVSHDKKLYSYDELQWLEQYLIDQARNYSVNEEVLWQIKIYIRDLLIVAIRNNYDIEMGRILCVPPYEIIEKDSKIVVYGAGLAGKSFVRQILHTKYAHVTGWVDRDIRGEYCGIEITSPEKLSAIDFDYILIAITDNRTVQSIISYLEKIGVSKERVLWKEIYWG